MLNYCYGFFPVECKVVILATAQQFSHFRGELFPPHISWLTAHIIPPPYILFGHEITPRQYLSPAIPRIFPVWQYTCHSKWLKRIRSRITSLRVIHFILSDLVFYKSAWIKLKWHSTGSSIWRHRNSSFPTSQRMSFVCKVFLANSL
jgi:hypothetical protein